jgi:hypothetical protein
MSEAYKFHCQGNYGYPAGNEKLATSYGFFMNGDALHPVDCSEFRAVRLKSAVFFKDGGASSSVRRSSRRDMAVTVRC